MKQADPIIEALMSPGAPFEVVDQSVLGQTMRVYKQAPQNLTQVFNDARQYSDLDFIVHEDRRFTYNQFFDQSDRLSNWLQQTGGIKPGQSVAICMKNAPEWMMSFVGILNIGAVPVLINSRGTGDTMRAGIEDTDTVFVIADARRLEALRKSGCKLPALGVGLEGVRAIKAENTTEFEQALRCPSEFDAITRSADEDAAMFFTSGTTGRAKAAVMTHRNLVTGLMNTKLAISAVFQRMAEQYGMDIEALRAQLPQNSSLLVFPLFHTSGCSATFLTSIASGGKLVLMSRWSGAGALALIEQERVMGFGGVPTMHWDVVKAAREKDYDLSSLRSISCGGQALPIGLLNEIRETFPNVVIGAGYGMTETSGAVSQANGENFVSRPEASGQVLTMVDVHVTDEAGTILPEGEVGEIWVKGSTIMRGYYGRPEANASAFKEGWFRTGDVGKVDADGYLTIVDRKTDMVISGGENIYCTEVEQALSKCKGVRQVVAFGIPDDRLGERLIASLVVANDNLTAADIDAFAKANIAAYKCPTDITVQVEPFELNAMGKVEKHKVRTAYQEKLG